MPTTRAQTRARRSVFGFLELPAEIRNEIYTLALGGRVIHVKTTGPRDGEVAVCSANPSEAVLDRSGPSHQLVRLPKNYVQRHLDCKQKAQEHLALGLLLVCKQIYAEAKNIPFQDNTFAFFRPTGLSDLLIRIGDSRFGLLRHILLFGANAVRPWATTPSALSSLPFNCLRTLHVYLEFHPNDLASGLYQSRDLLKRSFVQCKNQDAAFVCLSGLRSFGVEETTVVFDAGNFERRLGHNSLCNILSNEALNAWAGRIKRTVMGHRVDISEAVSAVEEA